MPVRPKYSIILPTLHGGRTLAVTLPAMLRIDRDDLEFVVSENHSEDGSAEIVRDLTCDDDRVRFIRPPERLPLGRHLEFAYRHATGRWIGHIGDDDHLLPWRFDLLDTLLDAAGERCALVRGEYLRYSWPDFPEAQAANSLDSARFDRKLSIRPGREFATELLNQSHVHGGGSWLVRHDLAGEVRRRASCFASPQHVEFFAMRAAAALAEQVAIVGLPLFILGRHSKSSGTQYFLPSDRNRERTWDWSFEDPETYRYCPFPWKSYSTLSFDAALTVQAKFPEELARVPIAWREWVRTIHAELLRLIEYRQLPAEALSDFYAALPHAHAGSTFYWRWRTFRIRLRRFLDSRSSDETPLTSDDPETILIPQRVVGSSSGIASIVDVAAWCERTFGEKVKMWRE